MRCGLALGAVACLALVARPVSASESFDEALTLRPLVGGRVHAAFDFTLTSDRASLHHFGVMPRALVQPLASLGVQDMHLSLSKGRWLYEEWGSPAADGAADEAVASGAEVWAAMTNETDLWPRWRMLMSMLASLSCASLDAVDETTTVQPQWPYFGPSSVLHSYLPSESVCTENLSPLLKLLPCKGGAGLASLLRPHALLRTEFHGIALRASHKDGVRRVQLRVQAVVRPPTVNDTLWTLQDLFDTPLTTTCAAATSSRIRVRSAEPPTPPVAPEEEEEDEDEDEDEVLPRTGALATYTVPQATYTYDTLALDKYHGTLNVALQAPAATHMVRPPPLRATRQVLGHGQERNTVRVTLRNDLPGETVSVVYYEQVPRMVRPLLHTLQTQVQVDEYDEHDDVVRYTDDVYAPFIVNATYVPAQARRRSGALEIALRVPAATMLTVTYTLEKHMLHYNEHMPDPHRGMDVPPALFLPLRGANAWADVHRGLDVHRVQASRLYTPPSLLDLAVPDFSMPYNIILFYSTFVALFFGSFLNLLRCPAPHNL
ncbi:Subunit of the glycosylphosphatidylinositol transamidase complex-like protein [Malassezia nana]|uniref:Subunit of the glycosylphosphatidylinositol transamidase complex-like protein n=1 Tax=Malassezia nana TaxID=180528 RepID=A0AAF0EJT5_9BASI|nr:Subunit of the glycosylphosphatidylinositol transamidase complex-like protein [Malassezia nana]